MASQNISGHDKAILNRIFNPNLPQSEEIPQIPFEQDTENEPESAEVNESKR
jgi:hypothetical protein